MMKLFIICVLSFLYRDSECSFINPYPRYKEYKNSCDCGTPLYLTPYIRQGDLHNARKLATVDHPDMQWLTSYAGYFTVNKKYNSNLFFWYFPAQLNPTVAPVILWLQGGPGSSSLFGLFTENGPFYVSTNHTLERRQYSWHINHHLIYIDNPVGSGFSFTDNEAGYATNENDVGTNLYEALQQFFILFPELQSNDFFLTGESYAGKYIPAIGHQILKKSQGKQEQFKINLQGLAIGNGLSDPINQINYGDYLYQLGLIDRNGHALFLSAQSKAKESILRREFEKAFEYLDEIMGFHHSESGSLYNNMTGFQTFYNYLYPNGDNASVILGEFIQMCDTRRAIHVGNNSFHDYFVANKVEEHLRNDFMDSVSEWVSELLSNYKVLIYNGQLDVIVAYPMTVNYLEHLQFTGADQYKTAKRIIWKVDDEIAGYVKIAGNLTEVLVRNAGHMVPADQPKWALDMLLRMTSGKGFL